MPFPFASVLLIAALLAGCTAQRGTADSPAADPDMADTTGMSEGMSDPADSVPQGGSGGMPNIAVYLDGTWDLTLTPSSGGAPSRGAWTIHEGGENRFSGLAGMEGPVRITDRSVAGDTFFLTGTAETGQGPKSFEASGTLSGNDMTGEITLDGMGTFDLTGARRLE